VLKYFLDLNKERNIENKGMYYKYDKLYKSIEKAKINNVVQKWSKELKKNV